jgi:hypothetical protein
VAAVNWYLWFLVAWFLLGAVLVVANVGKPRKATTPDIAAIIVVIDALLIAGIFVFGAH